jgi:hypothetical protein
MAAVNCLSSQTAFSVRNIHIYTTQLSGPSSQISNKHERRLSIHLPEERTILHKL